MWRSGRDHRLRALVAGGDAMLESAEVLTWLSSRQVLGRHSLDRAQG